MFTFAFQVHDELVLEADPSVIKEAGWLLQTSMEKAASLLGMSSEVNLCGSCCLLLTCASSSYPGIVWDLSDVWECYTIFVHLYHACLFCSLISLNYLTLSSSSFAGQNEGWENLGIFGAFPG